MTVYYSEDKSLQCSGWVRILRWEIEIKVHVILVFLEEDVALDVYAYICRSINLTVLLRFEIFQVSENKELSYVV